MPITTRVQNTCYDSSRFGTADIRLDDINLDDLKNEKKIENNSCCGWWKKAN